MLFPQNWFLSNANWFTVYVKCTLWMCAVVNLPPAQVVNKFMQNICIYKTHSSTVHMHEASPRNTANFKALPCEHNIWLTWQGSGGLLWLTGDFMTLAKPRAWSLTAGSHINMCHHHAWRHYILSRYMSVH